MNRINKSLLVGRLAAVIIAGALSANANAATQGTLGATSTGSVVINASIPAQAQVSGLGDVSFLNQNPGVAALNAQNVCVWSNTATKGYTVRASGNGTANAFTLSNGSSVAAYTVEWAPTIGQTVGTALTAGTASAVLTSTATNATCAAGPTASASLIVKMSTGVLGAMVGASTYTGTLTLLVTPQ